MHLFFTTAEFNALKATDPSIHNPSDLAVIKQPYTTANAPATYSPIAGEIKVAVKAWKAVAGGYYIEIGVKKFTSYTNYFIFPASVTLPLKANNLQFANAAVNNNLNKTFIKNMYPNPVTNGLVYLQTGNESVKEMLVEIFSADGKICYHQNLSYHPQTIHLNNVASGVYNMQISAGKFVYNGSLVINNHGSKN